ncbi:hypothetical protein [Vibrio sp. Hep-1b-8]|uniref:hypothetical protein n=1 Tax=Vibrio sp. Hep-1b-8 TaxID=2144187 RepID=UPI00111003B8|nr:hypothetical protein [Vibrio sp. Hep-1b-8]TMX35278.1 hypothetical protein DA100_14730 [Vibrio sp. Hep-1b-8]
MRAVFQAKDEKGVTLSFEKNDGSSFETIGCLIDAGTVTFSAFTDEQYDIRINQTGTGMIELYKNEEKTKASIWSLETHKPLKEVESINFNTGSKSTAFVGPVRILQ